MALVGAAQVEARSATGFGTGSFATGSFTPPNNCLLVTCVSADTASGSLATGITVSGGSLTWTKGVGIATPTVFGTFGAVEIWTAPVGTAALMTVSVVHATASIDVWCTQVIAYTGYNTGTPTGATATKQTNQTGAVDQGAVTITLSGTPASTSIVLAARDQAIGASGTTTATPGAGWTEYYDTFVTDVHGMETEERGGSASTSVDWVDVDVSGSGTFWSIEAALEILAAAAAAQVPFNRNLQLAPTLAQ